MSCYVTLHGIDYFVCLSGRSYLSPDLSQAKEKHGYCFALTYPRLERTTRMALP